jgi:hypothetical protein
VLSAGFDEIAGKLLISPLAEGCVSG